MTPARSAISATGLRKAFGDHVVLDGIEPTGMRWFADYRPFTPIMETLRGLLMGTPIGNSGLLAIAWSVGIGLVGYLWAKRLFNHDPTP